MSIDTGRYVRHETDARQLVGAGDQRVAVAVALAFAPDERATRDALASFTQPDQDRLVTIRLAARVAVELCMLGYRIGWDSAQAAVAMYRANEITLWVGWTPTPANMGYAAWKLARQLVDDGYAEPWPFRPDGATTASTTSTATTSTTPPLTEADHGNQG